MKAPHLRRRSDIGEIVHFVLAEGARRCECRPAIVVRSQDPENGQMVLHIFTDGLSDDSRFHDAMVRASVMHNDEMKPGSWHHREQCSRRPPEG